MATDVKDPTFEEEQKHLSETYATLLAMRDSLSEELEVKHKGIAQDLIDMSEEITLDFVGADETMETLAAIETLNSVIDTYNQYHDYTVDKVRRILLLLMQPYFAKVRLQMRPGRPARDVYIGAAGVTDDHKRPLIVDWRSPVAETYYNQQMGETSYLVDGKVRTVNLELRRQFDITRDVLNMYFDTTVAIQDSLLLGALKRHHTEKLQAITATIQREQNAIVRHDDVPALLVNGIAGSGKTSVMLQRIAFLLYRQRETLSPSQVYLFTPNSVFESYIDTVLPSLGESNPQTFTWASFMEAQGLSERSDGAMVSPDELRHLEELVGGITLEEDDLRGISVEGVSLLKPTQVKASVNKFSKFPVGPRLAALVKDDLHDKLERRFAQLAKDDELQEELLELDMDDQIEIFGRTIDAPDEEELERYTEQYARHLYGSAHDQVERGTWLRIDRIGMRMLGVKALSAAEWLYLKLLICGPSERDARYVMIDEVQDYTITQLMVLVRYFPRAHFLLLGDQQQAIREHTATFDQIKDLFAQSHGGIEECLLRTSYRSSPEITALFASLLDEHDRINLSSVRRPGIDPHIESYDDRDAYLDALRSSVRQAHEDDGLTAIITADKSRRSWLHRQLGDSVKSIHKGDALPKDGVVVMDLALAKGLEFDHVIIPDTQEEVYPDTPLARRRLYTAISRAMHRVTIFSQGTLTPLLAH
ncbi:MAG: ATP-binding domain-containing protein [Atopobiaceae bacterium]|nr:ATP-binding domain-containing protein [Atopobiaceae bacterium]MBR1829601.1 ATP-binding domain-containing protein [Atopobiaceae bacterium]